MERVQVHPLPPSGAEMKQPRPWKVDAEFLARKVERLEAGRSNPLGEEHRVEPLPLRGIAPLLASPKRESDVLSRKMSLDEKRNRNRRKAYARTRWANDAEYRKKLYRRWRSNAARRRARRNDAGR